jgi:hypothetical protein
MRTLLSTILLAVLFLPGLAWTDSPTPDPIPALPLATTPKARESSSGLAVAHGRLEHYDVCIPECRCACGFWLEECDDDVKVQSYDIDLSNYEGQYVRVGGAWDVCTDMWPSCTIDYIEVIDIRVLDSCTLECTDDE